MLKKILTVIVAVQLIVVPVSAETEKKPVHCVKGFIGIDDAVWIFIGAWSAIKLLSVWADVIEDRKIKEAAEKAKQQQKPEQIAPDCKL